MKIAAIEWGQLLEVIWVSLLAGIGTTALFSLIVFSTSRAAEARRTGGNAGAFGGLAILGLIAFAGVVVFAITVIVHKD